MTRRKKPVAKKAVSAQQMAQQAVDNFFAEFTAEVPGDGLPHILNATVKIAAQVEREMVGRADPEDHYLRAGYLVGLEVGKRLAGGAR